MQLQAMQHECVEADRNQRMQLSGMFRVGVLRL